jgi:hypothetical protein
MEEMHVSYCLKSLISCYYNVKSKEIFFELIREPHVNEKKK